MKKVLILILLSSIIFFSCSAIEQFVQKPTIKFKTLRFRDVGLFDTTVDFVFEIENPNPIGVTVNDLSYDLKLDNKNFIAGKLTDGISVKSSGKSTFKIPIEIDYIDFYGSVREFLTKDQLPYNISGDMKIFEFSIPYSHTGTIDIPEMPKVSLANVRVSDIGLSGASVVFDVKMKNRSDATVNLSGLNYDISLSNQSFGSGTASISESISGNGEKTISIPLDVDFVNLGIAAANILRGDDAAYKLKGKMNISGPKGITKEIPFDSAGNTDINMGN